MTEAHSHLPDKVIMVTGAGGGFGRLVAQSTAASGAKVVAVDLNGQAVTETVDLIVHVGGEALAVTADVASASDMRSAAAAAVEQFGSIDVLLNNAGIMPLAFFSDHEIALDAWHRAIDINFKGVVNGIAAVYDQMINQGRGHIINVSSIYGNRGVAGSGVYSATKAAVAVLSDALRVEAAGRIKVTVVRPTGVPATGLGLTVINYDATVGITGQNTERFGERLGSWIGGSLPPEATDPDDVNYWVISPEELAEQIVAVIDTPWGVNISDITVRATGEDYIL